MVSIVYLLKNDLLLNMTKVGLMQIRVPLSTFYVQPGPHNWTSIIHQHMRNTWPSRNARSICCYIVLG